MADETKDPLREALRRLCSAAPDPQWIAAHVTEGDEEECDPPSMIAAGHREYRAALLAARAALSAVLAPAQGTRSPDRAEIARRVVCLCGSTRFANEFMAASFREAIAGRIVLSVGCFPRKADGTWDRMQVTDEQKVALDALHFRKIEMADEVFVVNVGGYVGPSTANEIAHATKLGKPIRWLESPALAKDRPLAGDATGATPTCAPGVSAGGEGKETP